MEYRARREAKKLLDDISKSKLYTVCEIRPYLCLTGYRALEPHPTRIKELGFTHAIDVTNKRTEFHLSQRHPEVKYFDIQIKDEEDVHIQEYFDAALNFIREAKKSGGKIIVFCKAGMSRSATICLILLMMEENLSLREAFIEVEKVRPIISPNIGFWHQMIQYETEKRGKASVNLVIKDNREVPDVCCHKSVPEMNNFGKIEK